MKLSHLYAATAILPLALATALPAFAQTTATDTQTSPVPDPTQVPTDQQNPQSPNADAGSNTQSGGDIVVTGSRIRRDEFSVSDPITVIGKDEITQAGFASAADAL